MQSLIFWLCMNGKSSYMLENLVNDYLLISNRYSENDNPSLDKRARQSAGKIQHHLVQEILTGHTLEHFR